MNTVLRLSLGMVLAASLVGCHACGEPSCLHKFFGNHCGCGCQDVQCGGDFCCDGEVDCGSHRVRNRRSNWKSRNDAEMYGYGNSVVYTGDNCCGHPQPSMDALPMSGGCSGGGGASWTPQPAPGGCANCAAGAHPTPAAPPVRGGCGSCGAGATNESFYSPMNIPPTPAPPAEGIPGQNLESSPGDKAAGQGESTQKINWVPRQF